MIYAILLALALPVAAQEVSTDTASIPLIDQIQISNLGKDTRALLSGRYTQTGRPDFAGGVKVATITFGDGTTQYTAPSAGGTGLYHASFSSWTYPGGSGTAYTNTTFSVARDTLTWTSTAASSYTVVAMIAFSHGTANEEGYLWVLINGNFISGNSGSVWNCEGDSNGTDQFGQMTCVIPIPQLAAGTHTVSFGLGTRNGTLTGPRRRSVFGILQN